MNRLIVIGASTGGIEALRELLRPLPPDLPAAILIVLHIPPGPHVLDRILARTSALPVTIARDHETLQPGRVYLAASDRHLVVDGLGRAHTSPGPKENHFGRPSTRCFARPRPTTAPAWLESF